MGFFCSHSGLFSVLIIFGCSCYDFGTASDTITTSQFIKDPETLGSSGSLFTLGFFSPGNSTNRYVGIWYKSKTAVVWVANRNKPLMDSSGIVTISEDGNLVILNGQRQIIWSSNLSKIASSSSSRLLDSGNLVLLDNSTGNTLWQSFEHPSDTYLPSMKITRNKRTGEKLKFRSWKSLSDPSVGNFYMSLEQLDIPEVFIWNETRPYWRSGPWSGRVFTGVFTMNTRYDLGFTLVKKGDGTVYLTSTLTDEFVSIIVVLNSVGKLQERTWTDQKQWQVSFTVQNSDCDVYGVCGAFGSCSSNSTPICNCLRGFEPSNREEWNRQNWTNGCVRRTALQCEREKNRNADGKDGFLKLQMVKVPDFAEWLDFSEHKCRRQCLENCTCIAYSYDSNIGCLSWRSNLIDIQQFSNGGIGIYIRVAYSDLENGREVNKEKEREMIVIITVTVIIGTIIVVACAYFLWKWIAKHSGTMPSYIILLIANSVISIRF